MPERKTSKKRVAIWGATGAAGSELVRQCLTDSRIHSILVFTRRSIAVADPRIEQVLIEDFTDQAALGQNLRSIDAAFWCLGVSQTAVPEEDRYREITLDYVMAAASGLRQQSPGAAFHFLSGMGADPSGKSRMMWARVKGEAENALLQQGFPRLTIWRPGYIHVVAGREAPAPLGERILAKLAPLLSLVPGAVNSTVELARAMLRVEFDPALTGRFGAKRIKALAREYDDSSLS